MRQRHYFIILVAALHGCGSQTNEGDLRSPASVRARVGSPSAELPKTQFPIVRGRYQLTNEWSVTLPKEFYRRATDGSLVLWRPGFTIWANVWGNANDQPATLRLAGIRKGISSDAFDIEEESSSGLQWLAYRLKEPTEDKRAAAFYCFAVGEAGHVQAAMYFDHEEDLGMAKEIWRTLKEEKEL